MEIFCQIKPEYDQYKRVDGSLLVANELYTLEEIAFYHIPLDFCTYRFLNRDNTYFSFGARFC